ncbi:MAG: tetratricopeptide repeat protein [Nocardioides sp.]|uniref:tetratricopeptide repeat protein n=1 Tax=Nocardioides sp. TaxID=35761 RepID=UPI003263644F
MPRDLKGLAVFVASPGGLEKERARFFDVISRFNADDAHDAGLSFVPQGHELAYAGAGRPQSLINEQIRNSDYCLVVFWDKWGMKPSHGGYTSGTEEEFHVAIECLEEASAPMRDVVVFFKGVSDRQMSDPGREFEKVLEFRKRMEAERRIYYRTFDDIDEFAEELRRTLSKWARNWSNGDAQKASLPPAQSPPLLPTPEEGASVLERAKAAAKSGQTTTAHQLYTEATTGTYDRESWTEYVRFIRRSGRFGLLQTAADKMIEKARDLNDHQGAAEAFSNLGIAKRAQGQRTAAINYFDRALSEIDAWEQDLAVSAESQSFRAFILDNKGLTWRRMSGRLEEAVAAIQEAISLHKLVGDERGQAHALRNIGIVHAQLGKLDDSLRALASARTLFESAHDERGLAMSLGSIGETHELRGKLASAIEAFELALELNTSLANRQGKSMNMSQLSRVLATDGSLDAAEEYAEACLAINQESGSTEGQAAGLHASGRVKLARGEPARAAELLEDALDLFVGLDQPAGIAGTALELVQVHVKLGDLPEAQRHMEIANAALRQSPHYGLQIEAARLLRRLEQTYEDDRL